MKLIIGVLLVAVVGGCGKKSGETKADDKKSATKTDEGGSTRKSEAAIQLNKIAKNAKTAYAMNSEFPKGKAATLPESSGPGCCDGGKCKVSSAWASDPVWSSLDFVIDEPSLFRYTYESDGQTFTATAVGDLDCDGTTITYKLTGKAEGGNAQTTLEPPPPNSD